MHTLRWDSILKTWIVEFVSTSARRTIGFIAKGQDAVDLVNCLNGGQPATVTEDPRGGKLGVIPGPSDAEILKQLQDEEAKAPAA